MLKKSYFVTPSHRQPTLCVSFGLVHNLEFDLVLGAPIFDKCVRGVLLAKYKLVLRGLQTGNTSVAPRRLKTLQLSKNVSTASSLSHLSLMTRTLRRLLQRLLHWSHKITHLSVDGERWLGCSATEIYKQACRLYIPAGRKRCRRDIQEKRFSRPSNKRVGQTGTRSDEDDPSASSG